MQQEGDILKTMTDEMQEGIRKFVEETMGRTLGKKKIKAFYVRTRKAGNIKIEIGKYLDRRESDTSNEEVIAIFESDAFFVCTPNRGAFRGHPYIFGTEEVLQIEELE